MTDERDVPDVEGVEIVLLGSFNPRIFQPAWFREHKLISSLDADTDSLQLFNNDFCRFQTDWCIIQVTSDRFSVLSQTAPAPEVLRDLTQGTFAILEHTPVEKFAINHYAHMRMPNEAVWHAYGHSIVPKVGRWDNLLKNPGTMSVSLLSERQDTWTHGGLVRVVIEPSNVVSPGVFFQLNDEFDRPKSETSARWVVEALVDSWDYCQSQYESLQQAIYNDAISSESNG